MKINNYINLFDYLIVKYNTCYKLNSMHIFYLYVCFSFFVEFVGVCDEFEGPPGPSSFKQLNWWFAYGIFDGKVSGSQCFIDVVV